MDLPILPETLSVATVVLIAAIVVLGSIVQMVLGLGFGLTVAPLLAVIDPVLVPAPTLFLGMITAAWGAVAERHGIVWREAGIATVSRAFGVLVGVVILARLTTEAGFELVFGLLVLTAVILTAGGWTLAFNTVSLSCMGVVSGLMGTITSVGAPPLALIYRGRNPSRARPTLAAFFSFGCGASLIGLYAIGAAGWRDAALAAIMVPPMLAGIALSRLLRARADAGYRGILLLMAGGAGVVLILRGLAP